MLPPVLADCLVGLPLNLEKAVETTDFTDNTDDELLPPRVAFTHWVKANLQDRFN